MKNNLRTFSLIFLALGLLAVGGYFLPPVHSRLAWRVDAVRTRIKYALNPPEKSVFTPQEQTQVEAIVSATLSALSPAESASPTPQTAVPAAPPTGTASPTPSATPLPAEVHLQGAVHEYQQWNNCGPATLAMALSFWHWEGDQRDTAAVLKPNPRDKNVMPYEMAAFVNQHTALRAVWRVGGDGDTLKRLLAAGFPVIVEKGFEGPGFDGWMGHYGLLVGYDDAAQQFWVLDSYEGPDREFTIPYAKVFDYWPQFNHTYLLIYPPERESEALGLLGADADESENYRRAAQRASDDIFSAETPRQQFFAWFNRGTNLAALDDYTGAAQAYDQAFAIYPQIPEDERPWRILWYQTGPYRAYFYTGRYYDVISLADTTLNAMSEPVLEESFYWRGMAKNALGDRDGALADLREALRLNPNLEAAQYALDLIEAIP
ncbi:MAG: hypothetical protein Fur0018_15310 [Anaerolineales bacterium]